MVTKMMFVHCIKNAIFLKDARSKKKHWRLGHNCVNRFSSTDLTSALELASNDHL